MTLKPGVRITGIKAEALVALMVAESVYRSLGYEMTVTSVCEGTHSRGSIHYVGMAFDLRTSNLSEQAKHLVRDSIAEQLGADFDVVLEKDHLHCEFEPKQPL